jgi:hypothetical protein
MNTEMIDTLDSLAQFIPAPPTGVEQLGKVPSRPRPATVNACAEIDRVWSVDELKRTRGYMSAAAYRIFAQCGGRRR